ncbi:ThiF family adenylyltransferase [Leucothrix mucor]|uniref:ThiF family adenylyltransferase n=1 Tax=Leucothrix mucor TaxID=45248 RepID=UPI0003B48C62|nr:ThiF family adenylyltransferase [Leucothrix mucor]
MAKEQLDTLTTSIQEAIEQIRHYPAVNCVKEVSIEMNVILIKTDWAVKLPNAFLKQKVSNTGVREIENVYWKIPLDYPLRAPSPRLRADFPINLPHINPHTQGELVFPCVYEASLEDLLHSIGLTALLDATTQWLNNAAADELHCPVQGWEHMRRDDINGLIYTDTHSIRNELDNNPSSVKFYNYRYCRVNSSNDWLLGTLLNPSLGSLNSSIKKKHLGVLSNTKIRNAPSVLFQTADESVFDEYHPETVHDFLSLRTFAKDIDLQLAFDARLKHILSLASPEAMGKQNKAAIEEFLVVFAIRRPFHLIGIESPWELLAYRVFFDQKNKGMISNNTVVRPAQLTDQCSPRLLQAVSGKKVEVPVRLALLGCGSLGSKIGLHLAKTGGYQFELVDNDYFSSHNNARHGLIVPNFSSLCTSKAELLSREMTNLNVFSKSIDEDIRAMNEKEGFSLNKKTEYTLDTTASLSVRYCLSHHCNTLPGRLIQSTLYGKSTVGIVAIEGENRSVRCDDIAAFTNTLCIDHPQIKQAMYGGNGPELNHFGEGCGSVTTIMNDTDISLMSAAAASRINTEIQQGKTRTDGALHVGVINPSSLEMNWMTYIFSPTLTIARTSRYEWDVRVIGTIVRRIEELSNRDPTIENGGVIGGQVCHLSKTIYVNYLLDAPKGSVHSQSFFALNTDGLPEEFERIHGLTNGQITFLGTWHSHTNATPPSAVDRDSLKRLQVNYDLPIVMLTYTGGHIVRVEC